MDVVAQMQHRNRNAVHDLRGTRAMLQNACLLHERNGDSDHLIRAVTIAVRRITELEESLQTPPPAQEHVGLRAGNPTTTEGSP